ncbi:MAG: methyl-accepting chemotaxis protein [Motiliproteus sp.]
MMKSWMEVFKNDYINYVSSFRTIYGQIKGRNRHITKTLNRVGPDIGNQLEQVKLSAKNEQDQLGPKVQHDTENTVSMVAWFSIIAILTGIGMAWFMARVIRQPIGGEPREIAAITQAISDGDLTQDLDISAKDTGIYRSVGEMSVKLKGLIGGIIETSRSLSDTAQSAAQISTDTSAIIDQQQHKTTSVAASVAEMAASIQEVVRHATESATLSNDGMVEVERGKTTVSNTLAEIGKLAKNLENSVEIIKSLSRTALISAR